MIQYLHGVSDRITWPTFGPKKQPPPPGASLAEESIPNEKGHPSPEAYASIFNLKFARPKDFFDLQISHGYIAIIQKGTNYRASVEGVGLGKTGREAKKFGDFKPFDDHEFYKFIGLLIANGLNPRSNFESWFTSSHQSNRPLYASVLFLEC